MSDKDKRFDMPQKPERGWFQSGKSVQQIYEARCEAVNHCNELDVAIRKETKERQEMKSTIEKNTQQKIDHMKESFEESLTSQKNEIQTKIDDIKKDSEERTKKDRKEIMDKMEQGLEDVKKDHDRLEQKLKFETEARLKNAQDFNTQLVEIRKDQQKIMRDQTELWGKQTQTNIAVFERLDQINRLSEENSKMQKTLEDQKSLTNDLSYKLMEQKEQLTKFENEMDRFKKDVNSKFNALEIATDSGEKTNILAPLLRNINRTPGFEGLTPEVVFNNHSKPFDTDDFFKAVRGLSNVAIIARTNEQDRIFGVTYTKPLKGYNLQLFDPDITVFVNRQWDQEQPFAQFQVLDEEVENVFIQVICESKSGILRVGSDSIGQFWIGKEKSESFSENLSKVFRGLRDDTLTGHNGKDEKGFYHCKQIIVLHFKED